MNLSIKNVAADIEMPSVQKIIKRALTEQKNHITSAPFTLKEKALVSTIANIWLKCRVFKFITEDCKSFTPSSNLGDVLR